MRRALCAVPIGLAVLACSLVAGAQDLPRVALGPMTGPHAETAAHEINAALIQHSDAIELLPSSAYAQAAQRMGVVGSSEGADIARVARSIRLDAVIAVEVTRRGRGLLLHVRVVRGHDGSTAGIASWELRNASEMQLVGGEYWEQLHPYLQVDTELRAAAASEAANHPTGAQEGSAPPATASTGAAAAPTPGLGVVEGRIEIGGAMRSWRMPVLGELSPRGYDNGGYAEAAAEVMGLYRLANERWGVGASAAVTFPISISSRAVDSMGNVIPLPTTSFEVWGGLAAAFRPPGGGLMRADVGAVFHSFTVDTSMLSSDQQLAPMSYAGLRVAMEGVLPVYANANWEVGVVFGTELRVAVVSAEARTAFGRNASLSLGLGGTAGLSLRLDGLLPGLAVRVTGAMLRYRTTFAGPATIGTGSDSVDDYFRFHAAISYAFGTHRPGAVAEHPAPPAEESHPAERDE